VTGIPFPRRCHPTTRRWLHRQPVWRRRLPRQLPPPAAVYETQF